MKQDELPMWSRQYAQGVQQALQKSGVIGQHFNGHSFRIGQQARQGRQSSKYWVGGIPAAYQV